MARKYIKDKNGKFAGSVPSAQSWPVNSPALPKLPSSDLSEASALNPVPYRENSANSKYRKLIMLTDQANKHKKAYQSQPLFSQARKDAKAKYSAVNEKKETLRKELTKECWRCYGTGKPLNSYGDTLEIFLECPECDAKPARS
jgi:hypothetical protein